MKKMLLLLALLLSVGLMSCDKSKDDTQPIVPEPEKMVEITVNFGPIPDDFDHEGGILVHGVALFTEDVSKQFAVINYAHPTTKSVFAGDSYVEHLGETVYLYVRLRRTLEGFSTMDHNGSWDTEIYVRIDELKEKNTVYVEYPADHQAMVIGKP